MDSREVLKSERSHMKKFWMVYCLKNEGKLTRFDDYAEVLEEAKRRTSATGDDHFILESVSVCRRPLPPIDVMKLT